MKRKTEVQVKEETKNEYYKGQIFITNMRLVFQCRVDAFDLLIPSISSVKQFKDGLRVISGMRSYDVMTADVQKIIHIIDLMNKAQSSPQMPSTNAKNDSPRDNLSRNDSHAIAALIHYCEFGGKPIGTKNEVYPSYIKYTYHVNNPIKYHQKVIDEGYLVEAPVINALQRLKVDQLKSILISNGLSDKGKKDVLIQRIAEEVDLTSLNIEKIYIPSEKGWAHLKKYDYLFKVEKFNIRVEEFERQRRKMAGAAKTNDIIWAILGEQFNNYNLSRDFGLARNTLYNKAVFLAEENRQTDALQHYILVLYYDMSGCGNSGMIDSKDSLCLAPGITGAIFERKELFQDEMLDKCYSRYRLPHHYYSRDQFARLLQMIFEDETIDLLRL